MLLEHDFYGMRVLVRLSNILPPRGVSDQCNTRQSFSIHACHLRDACNATISMQKCEFALPPLAPNIPTYECSDERYIVPDIVCVACSGRRSSDLKKNAVSRHC